MASTGFRHRPAGRGLGVPLLGALLLYTLLSVRGSAHEGDLKLDHRLPPYVGPGHQGAPITADGPGQILDFQASGVTLLSWLPLATFGGGSANANDIYGYASPGGREYAILGLERGTAFVDITNPLVPFVVKVAPDSQSLWSDMTTVGEYAYNVNERGGGVQVFDLRQIDSGIVTLVTAFRAAGVATSHTITRSPVSPYVFLNGSQLGVGGLVAVDVSDPANPVVRGQWQTMYVHDSWIHHYADGPFAGREIAFCACGVNGLRIVDVTNKNNLFTVGGGGYPHLSYCHHSWLDESEQYLFVNDELDEIWDVEVNTTTTYVFDVSDIANPVYSASFTNGNTAVDHNPMGRGRYLYEANYSSGLRIYDIADMDNIHEVGYFDSRPENDLQSFNGAWGVYAGLPSGVILVSDMERGLFVLQHDAATSTVPHSVWDGGPRIAFGVHPNPFRERATISFDLPEALDGRIRIMDVSGRVVETVEEGRFTAGLNAIEWNPGRTNRVAPGVYFAVFESGFVHESRQVAFLR